MTQNKGVT